MKRGLILFTAAMTVITTSVIMWNQPEETQASIQYAYESTAKPVEVPYLDLTINQVKEQQSNERRTNHDGPDEYRQGPGATDSTSGEDGNNYSDGSEADAGSSMPELVEPGADNESNESDAGGTEDPILTYYGNCRITFYDAGPCCCDEYADGYTANGDEAIVGWTCANGALDFGTLVMIDGQTYCVTDRGVGSYEFDILVSSHEEALQRGLYYTDVYLIEE